MVDLPYSLISSNVSRIEGVLHILQSLLLVICIFWIFSSLWQGRDFVPWGRYALALHRTGTLKIAVTLLFHLTQYSYLDLSNDIMATTSAVIASLWGFFLNFVFSSKDTKATRNLFQRFQLYLNKKQWNSRGVFNEIQKKHSRGLNHPQQQR